MDPFIISIFSKEIPENKVLTGSDYDSDLVLSAPQLGHIQMDPGLIVNEPHSIIQLNQSKLLRPFLSLGEIVGIMDHLILFESLWFSGAPIYKTLFTNVYMFRPDLAPTPLRAFCVSVLHFVDLVKDLAFNAQISTVFKDIYLYFIDYCSLTLHKLHFQI